MDYLQTIPKCRQGEDGRREDVTTDIWRFHDFGDGLVVKLFISSAPSPIAERQTPASASPLHRITMADLDLLTVSRYRVPEYGIKRRHGYKCPQTRLAPIQNRQSCRVMVHWLVEMMQREPCWKPVRYEQGLFGHDCEVPRCDNNQSKVERQ